MTTKSFPHKLHLAGALLMVLSGIVLTSLLVLSAQDVDAAPPRQTQQSQEQSIFYQENDPRLVLSGTWTIFEDSEALGGAYLASNEMDAQVSLNFTGTSIALYRHLSPEGGRAAVQIDGEWHRVSFNRKDNRPQTPYVIDQLDEGSHWITITVSSPFDESEGARFVQLDALAVPSTPDSAVSQQAIARVNYYRQLTNLPLIRNRDAIHFGAQAHAEYLALNRGHSSLEGLGAHRESETLPGFVGVTSRDRAAYFGYTRGVGEVVNYLGDPVQSVDSWMETVYHRNLVLCYDCTEAGYGMVNDGRGKYNVLNMGSEALLYPLQRLLYTYPIPNQHDVPILWNGLENPDPLPDVSGWVGYPISLYLVQPDPGQSSTQSVQSHSFDPFAHSPASPQWALASAELRDASGRVVPTYLLDQATDPHARLSADEVFLIPMKPLERGSTYYVHMSGTDSRGQPFNYEWSFSTVPATVPNDISTNVSTCSGEIRWSTGKGVTSMLRLGTSAGNYMQDVPTQAEPTLGNVLLRHTAVLSDLVPNTTYHYQIVTADVNGGEYVGPDASFSTDEPHIYTVSSSDSIALASAIQDARECDIIQVAAGHYSGSFLLLPKVQLLGAGSEQTVLQGTGGSVLEILGDNLISGLTIQGSGSNYWDSGIYFFNPAGVLHDIRIQQNENGVVLSCYEPPCLGQVSVLNSIISHNRNQGIFIGEGVANTQIINNTLVGNRFGVFNRGHHTTLRNNILVQNETAIFSPVDGDTLTVAYNNLWKNEEDSDGVKLGAGNVAVNPLFIDAKGGNYNLAPQSPMIDAGDPNPLYADASGSRNDMGATGGPSTAATIPQLEITATPLNPLPGESVHYTLQLSNRGRAVDEVQIQLTLPPAMHYTEEVVQVSQGVVEQQESTLTWAVGTAFFNVPLTLQFTAKVDTALSTPTHARLPVMLTWAGGQQVQEHLVIIGGTLLLLPEIRR